MRYDISKATAPAMPNLGKGTECIKILLSQASKDMHEPLVPMEFSAFAVHLCDKVHVLGQQKLRTMWPNGASHKPFRYRKSPV